MFIGFTLRLLGNLQLSAQYRIVVGPDPLAGGEVLEGLDSLLDLPGHLDQERLLAQKAHDCVNSVGRDPVEKEAHDLGHHLQNDLKVCCQNQF